VDEIGTLEDAVRYIAKEAGVKGKPKVVYPVRKLKGLQELLLGSHDDDEGFDGEEHSLIDGVVSRIADRITGPSNAAKVLPAGIYAIWNGAR
jgi:ClpP class serine protease